MEVGARACHSQAKREGASSRLSSEIVFRENRIEDTLGMDMLLSSGLRRASWFVDLFCNCLRCVVVDGLRKFFDICLMERITKLRRYVESIWMSISFQNIFTRFGSYYCEILCRLKMESRIIEKYISGGKYFIYIGNNLKTSFLSL